MGHNSLFGAGDKPPRYNPLLFARKNGHTRVRLAFLRRRGRINRLVHYRLERIRGMMHRGRFSLVLWVVIAAVAVGVSERAGASRAAGDFRGASAAVRIGEIG